MNEPRIILSLDYADASHASALVGELDPKLCRIKIGKELFTHAGPALIEQISGHGFEVFLDLKFHDIPNTVASACAAAAAMGVWMINVHASGGERMLLAAREAVNNSRHQPLLIAVTVLTSMTDDDLRQVGVSKNVEQQVMDLAKLAHQCELDGVICSAREVNVLKREFGSQFKLVTPGIRPEGAGQDDQRRVMTPYEAIRAGSDYLVIGRPITRAKDPLQALIAINEEIKKAINKL